MPRNLYLVFSSPPDGVSWEEYNDWYEQHARENVRTPGFVGVTRYAASCTLSGRRLAPGVFEVPTDGDVDAPPPHNYVAVYEFDGDIDELRAHLLGRVESGDIALPSWFDRIRFETWTAVPLGDRIEPER